MGAALGECFGHRGQGLWLYCSKLKDCYPVMSVRPNEQAELRKPQPADLGFRSGARNLGRIFAYANSYWRQLSLVLFALLATGAFALATPLLLEWAVDTALGAGDDPIQRPVMIGELIA